MKTIIKFFVTTSIFFSFTFCNAQIINTPAQWLAYQQRELKGCSYIFEGTITKQKPFSSRTGRMMCSVMQITKIYKGSRQIKLGSIKIITNQYSKEATDIGPNVGRGHYIIFSTPANSSSLVDTLFTTDNLLIFQTNDWIAFSGGGASWGWRKVSKYPTVDSLYSFFRENGVTVQEEVEQK